jgi:hypothetical protein
MQRGKCPTTLSDWFDRASASVSAIQASDDYVRSPRHHRAAQTLNSMRS